MKDRTRHRLENLKNRKAKRSEVSRPFALHPEEEECRGGPPPDGVLYYELKEDDNNQTRGRRVRGL